MYLLSGVNDENLKEVVSADLKDLFPDLIHVDLEYSTGEANYEDVPSKVKVIVLEDSFVNFDFKEAEYKERYPKVEHILYFCFKEKSSVGCKEAVCFENHLSYKTWLKGYETKIRDIELTQLQPLQPVPPTELDGVVTETLELDEEQDEGVVEDTLIEVVENDLEEKILFLKEQLAPPIWQRTRIQKTVAIWSPIRNVGVSTFVMNFALYLSKMPLSVGVIEMLGSNYRIKSLLKQYSSQPLNWQSFSTYLFEDNINPNDVNWEYGGVNWYPVNPENDNKYEWDTKSLYYYFNGLKYNDVLLMDLPTGNLEDFVHSQLSSVNELWILVNNQVNQVLEWKNYIKQLEDMGLNCHLIFHRDQYITQKHQLSKKLELPIITEIPDMYHQMLENEYQNFPLIKQKGTYEIVENGYKKLALHLLGVEPHNPKSIISSIKKVKEKFQRGLIWK